VTPADMQQMLAEKFGESVGPLQPAKQDPWVLVKPEALREVCAFLKSDPRTNFDCLINLSAVDWPKKNQIEVVYHLWSYALRHTFVLKVQLDRAAPAVDSLEPVWKAADWLEREQFDLFGVQFKGHPDLRRIMLPDDWVGHPLLKDYKEGTDYHGISTTRESPLDGFVRLDEFKKRAAAKEAEHAAPAPHGAAATPTSATQTSAAPGKDLPS
jgi:NADH-quinone oxidoreductase subunit C